MGSLVYVRHGLVMIFLSRKRTWVQLWVVQAEQNVKLVETDLQFLKKNIPQIQIFYHLTYFACDSSQSSKRQVVNTNL
jgi:hypothetical protein